MAEIDEMLLPDKNYKNYRATLHKTNTPLVPFLGMGGLHQTSPLIEMTGMYLSDLVFIETGNPDTLDNNPNLINFKKCKLIAKVRLK